MILDTKVARQIEYNISVTLLLEMIKQWHTK